MQFTRLDKALDHYSGETSGYLNGRDSGTRSGRRSQ